MKSWNIALILGILTSVYLISGSSVYARNCDTQNEFDRIRNLPQGNHEELVIRQNAIESCLQELYVLLAEQQFEYQNREVNADTYLVNNIMRDQIYYTVDYISQYRRL